MAGHTQDPYKGILNQWRSKKKPLNPELFINREISLLDFQSRVLEEAQDENNPLLERVKFLATFGSNMDEFFMVRVAGLRRQVDAGIIEVSPDGMTPREQLAAIRKRYIELDNEAHQCLQRKFMPKLEKAGIHILDYEKASQSQKEKADAYFREIVYPVLTPLALDLAHPFPHITNLSLNLAIVIRDPKGNEKFARLKVPNTLPRLIPIKRSSGATRKDGTIPFHHYFIWLEQVIAANIGSLFPGMEIVSVHPFRIVRDADTEIQELEADDLLESMEQTIRQRRFGSVAHVSVYENLPANIRDLLLEYLEIKRDVFVQRKPLGLVNLWQVYNSVERHDLKYPAYKQHIPKVFRNAENPEDIFEAIRQRNILIHHPYNSFNPVIDFLNVAARDPHLMRAMLDMSTSAQIKDSLRLGSEVLARMGRVGPLHKPRVEQAGFAVLKAPDIPSILVETAFISNPDEEAKLRDPTYRAEIVEALATGIKRYFARNPPLARLRPL